MLKRFNGILSLKIQLWDGLLSIFSLGKAINFYNFMIVERVRPFGSVPFKLQLRWWVCASRNNKLETEGGSRAKGDSNTIPKNRLYLLRQFWQGSYVETKGIQDFRGHWQMAVGVRNHSARVYLYIWLPHCSIVQLLSKCSGSTVWMSTSEKMHTGRAPKAIQRVQNSPQHVLQTPEAVQLTKWVKVYPGSRAIFWGHQRSRWVI